MTSMLDPISDAVAAIAAGRAVVVVDDEDREHGPLRTRGAGLLRGGAPGAAHRSAPAA